MWVKGTKLQCASHDPAQFKKKMYMKRLILVPVALAIALVGGVASAVQGDWLGRARVININPDPGSETTLEPDFTYFVTHNLGMELILATRKHDIMAGGKPVGQDQPAGSRRQDEVLMAVVSR